MCFLLDKSFRRPNIEILMNFHFSSSPIVRATLEQMRQAATATSSDNKNGAPRTNNNLVNNAQPLSFTNPPPFDSNA